MSKLNKEGNDEGSVVLDNADSEPQSYQPTVLLDDILKTKGCLTHDNEEKVHENQEERNLKTLDSCCTGKGGSLRCL